LKSDPSAQVKRAALISLAGFGEGAKEIVAVIVRQLESTKSDHAQFILLLALADIDKASPQMRKWIGSALDYYNRRKVYRYPGFSASLSVLAILESDGARAIAKLIDTAKTALVRGDEERLGAITTTLVKIGGGDPRVLKFYETAARTGPEQCRVYCDSVAKRLRLQAKP